jgi:hypothetical protein
VTRTNELFLDGLKHILLMRKDSLEKNEVSKYREWSTVLGNWDIILVRRRKGDVEIGTLDPRAGAWDWDLPAVDCHRHLNIEKIDDKIKN